MALSLITDRTAADVARIATLRAKINVDGWASLSAAEQAEWAAGRGTYNAEDLNRVGAAIQVLTERLTTGCGFAISTSPVTTWAGGSAPSEFRQADADTLLEDLATIRAVFPVTTTTPASLGGLTYQGANDIEQMLLEVDDYIAIMAKTFVPCGDAICGGDYL